MKLLITIITAFTITGLTKQIMATESELACKAKNFITVSPQSVDSDGDVRQGMIVESNLSLIGASLFVAVLADAYFSIKGIGGDKGEMTPQGTDDLIEAYNLLGINSVFSKYGITTDNGEVMAGLSKSEYESIILMPEFTDDLFDFYRKKKICLAENGMGIEVDKSSMTTNESEGQITLKSSSLCQPIENVLGLEISSSFHSSESSVVINSVTKKNSGALSVYIEGFKDEKLSDSNSKKTVCFDKSANIEYLEIDALAEQKKGSRPDITVKLLIGD